MSVTKTLNVAVPYIEDGKVVRWELGMKYEQGTEGQADYYYADVYGAMPLTSPDPNDFVLYENLTEADVDVWLNKMTEPTPAEMDAQLAANIELQKNPIEETLPLPWDES